MYSVERQTMNPEDRGQLGVLMHCEINFASALTLLLPHERKIIFQLVFLLVVWYSNLIIQASTYSIHQTPYQSWLPEHLISFSDFVSRRTPSEGESSILAICCCCPVLASFAWVLLLFSGILINSCSNPIAELFPCLPSARGRLLG